MELQPAGTVVLFGDCQPDDFISELVTLDAERHLPEAIGPNEHQITFGTPFYDVDVSAHRDTLDYVRQPAVLYYQLPLVQGMRELSRHIVLAENLLTHYLRTHRELGEHLNSRLILGGEFTDRPRLYEQGPCKEVRNRDWHFNGLCRQLATVAKGVPVFGAYDLGEAVRLCSLAVAEQLGNVGAAEQLYRHQAANLPLGV